MAGRPNRVSDERIHGPACQDPTEGCPTLEYFKAVPLTEDKGGESVFGRKQTGRGRKWLLSHHVWPLMHQSFMTASVQS